ncbi:MAG TPA: hypothetical protein VHQ46_04840 [Desulfobacteria bacterium]|nr:hypothetical protein [Desulfobacteria bacterium]
MHQTDQLPFAHLDSTQLEQLKKAESNLNQQGSAENSEVILLAYKKSHA